MTVELPVRGQIIPHVRLAQQSLRRVHVNRLADGCDGHVLALRDERDVTHVRLLQDEEMYEVAELLALELGGDARLDHTTLPCRRRLVAVGQPLRELRVDAERADY